MSKVSYVALFHLAEALTLTDDQFNISTIFLGEIFP
jgi:hypothetical protein